MLYYLCHERKIYLKSQPVMPHITRYYGRLHLLTRGQLTDPSLKAYPHRASASTLALPLVLAYIVMLGNGSETDFQTSPALAADAWCVLSINSLFTKTIFASDNEANAHKASNEI